MNSFFGLEMGKRALNAFRMGIQTAGHNITNVKSEGYSRQRVNLSAADPYTMPGLMNPGNPGQIGTGVSLDEIVRIRDEFLDFQYRSELSDLGYWSKINSMYETVQLYIAEPSGSGVRAAFNSFWSALQDLQKNPEIPAAREAVVQAATSLGTMIDTIVKGYDQYASIVNSEVKSAVDQANTILYEIASLNKQIYQIKALGQNPNDLLDKRDVLLDNLSKMMDIEIDEPFTAGDVTGEFFITLNGRAILQGDKVRELVAHAFEWEGKTYYDVQVRDNEFDIVSDCTVALALATGPEGVHQLNVDRLANGKEWTVGGEDPVCLNPDGTPKTVLTSKTFANGIVTGPGTVNGETKTFTVKSGGDSIDFTLTWNGSEWEFSNSKGIAASIGDSGDGDLSVDELVSYMNEVLGDDSLKTAGSPLAGITATANGNSFALNSSTSAITVTDSSGLLDFTTSFVQMRLRPLTTDEALGLLGSFRIQVGSQGTQVASKIFSNSNNPDLAQGDILGAGSDGDSYTFRVGAGDYQVDVTVSWDGAANGGAGGWVMTSDTGKPPLTSATDHLSVEDLSDFLKSVLPSSGDDGFSVNVGPQNTVPKTQFSIGSNNNYLISISDVKGDLAAQMGMANPNPTITIDVVEIDTLETIRNKINEKYQEAYGLTNPEQWVHASLEQAPDQSWYLSIASNVAGEAQRITIMGDDDGNMQLLRRLGLVKTEKIGTDAAGSPIYREVTGYSKVAEDASFTFNGVRYLSSDNKFEKARRVPAGTNRSDYSASTLERVSEGLWLELKGIGRTTINVQHHVKGGSIKALEEIRDGLIPGLKGELDEIVWSLVNSFNAYQYSGYGMGEENSNTTGVAFFNTLGFKSGSSSLLAVTQRVQDDLSLIGAAMGKLDENGKATYGTSAGSGSGANASRMAGLESAKLLNGNSSSLADAYSAYLAEIGGEAGRAALMYKAQKNLTEQINAQRQSVMGVNIDEEMLDILMFIQAFNAISRYVTTIDEMLDRIINGFGLVGR